MGSRQAAAGSDIAFPRASLLLGAGDVGSSRSFVTEAANVLSRETKIQPSVVARPRGARGRAPSPICTRRPRGCGPRPTKLPSFRQISRHNPTG